MSIDILTNIDTVLPLTREWIEIIFLSYMRIYTDVLPLTREWIEMDMVPVIVPFISVLPLTREWIEMPKMVYN